MSYGSRAETYNDFQATPRQHARKSAVRGPLASLDELTNALQGDIEAGADSLVSECTTSELSLDLSALIPLHRPNIGPYADGGEHDLPPEFKASWTNDRDPRKSHPQANIQAIISVNDPRVRQIVQRAASRGIVAAIEAIDGFKYSFNNAWSAKDEDGQRFSYICQDSMQNKDRHANGFTRTQKHLKGEGERGVRKPTFDCKGSVSVKCSLNKSCVDVYYRHYAIHPTISERRSLPKRPQQQRQSYDSYPGSEEHDYSRVDSGGLFGKLQAETSAFSAPPKIQPLVVVAQQQVLNIGRPLKRKRDSDAPTQPRDLSKPLSLVELLKQSESAASPPPSRATPARNGVNPPPVNYDLPSWQKPPPMPIPTPIQPPQNGTSVATPYQPYQTPYQPTQHSMPHAHMPAPPAPPAPQLPPPLPPPMPQQEYFGPPKPHPQSQGLFTTMKPVAQDPPITGYVPLHSVRAKTSCTNCRYGKKKVSESVKSWTKGIDRTNVA